MPKGPEPGINGSHMRAIQQGIDARRAAATRAVAPTPTAKPENAEGDMQDWVAQDKHEGDAPDVTVFRPKPVTPPQRQAAEPHQLPSGEAQKSKGFWSWLTGRDR